MVVMGFLPAASVLAAFLVLVNNMDDFTCVESVAHAHICAERALASEVAVAERAAGEAYFVTNMEPVKFWEFVSLVLEGLGYERAGYTIEKIPGSNFHFSEEMSHQVALSVASWNSVVNGLKSLCKGNDWMLFLKVVLSLLILSFLGAFSLQNLFIMGLPIAFVAFFMYDKREEEINCLVSKFFSFGYKLKSDTAGKIL